MNFSTAAHVLQGDSAEVFTHIRDGVIDLVVTSPPYNVDLGNNKYNNSPYDLYNDNKDHQAYLLWLASIIKQLHRVLTFGGRMVINIGDGKNGAVPTHSDIIHICTSMGFIPFSTIIWNKGNTSNRAAWGSWCSPSSPSFPSAHEYILIFSKDVRKIQHSGDSDLVKREFVEWATGMWSFPGVKSVDHPAVFPEELPKRCIKMLSYIGDIVLDPFAGTGTTLVAAQKLGRSSIGIELSEDYCKVIKNRLPFQVSERGKIDIYK